MRPSRHASSVRRPDRRPWWRRPHAVAATAAVVVFAAVAGVALLWDVTHVPTDVSRPTVTASPTPSTTPPAAAAALLRSSAAALRASSTAHVAGVIGAPTPVRVDLSVTQNGDAEGGLVVNGVPVDVVRTGGRTYLRSRRFVENVLGGTVASLVGDRWLALGTSGLAGTGVTDALDRATSLDGIASLVSSTADLAQGGVRTTRNGRRVVEVVTGPSVVDVAADGLPYPLRVTAGEGTELALDRFGAPVVVTPPRDVVDLSRLPGIG